MIELFNNTLEFSFPKVHDGAKMSIDFQRTLRIPDDDRDYPLPPGLGRFPLRHVDDYASRVPAKWIEHGGVMLPMYQSEAMWINFAGHYVPDRGAYYPFAVKIATGKINAVTGEQWTNGLEPNPQDYMVVPDQPWLDGYCVEKGVIRQFVAMPLGAGYSAEEQITKKAEHGGVQVIVYPMKREVFERRFPVIRRRIDKVDDGDDELTLDTVGRGEGLLDLTHEPDETSLGAVALLDDIAPAEATGSASGRLSAARSMSLAPGGRMKQNIHDDPFDINDWDRDHSSRCFVHLANSITWRAITGSAPPTQPPTSRDYSNAGLPWFEHYSDSPALDGSGVLRKLKSVLTMGKDLGESPLPENDPAVPQHVVNLRAGLRKGQVRESEW